MTLRLDVTANGAHAPFFVALSRGYYKAVGLAVRIGDGKGSVITAEDVAQGHDDFGFPSADAAAVIISKGARIKLVADFIQKNPGGIVYPLTAPITKPAGLIGKTLGVQPGTASFQYFKAFEAANHLKPAQMTFVAINGLTARATALKSGRVAAVVTFPFAFVPILDALGIKTGSMSMANFGVDSLGNGIAVNSSFLAQHPGQVRAFVAASVRGWRWTMAHPAAAVALERHYRPQLKPAIALPQLELSLALLHTSASQGHPIGWMARSDWQATLSTAHRFEGLGTVLPLSKYYTNAFLPQSST